MWDKYILKSDGEYVIGLKVDIDKDYIIIGGCERFKRNIENILRSFFDFKIIPNSWKNKPNKIKYHFKMKHQKVFEKLNELEKEISVIKVTKLNEIF